MAEMSWAAWANLSLAQHVPGLAYFAFGGLTANFLAHWPEAVEHLRSLSAPPTDLAVLALPEVRAVLNRTVSDAMRNGAQGARRDLILFTKPWGIDLEAIDFPLEIWQGEADGTVPVAHARWYQDRLPDCRAHYVRGEGHYSLPLHHAATILTTLRQTAAGALDPQDN